MEKNIGIVLKTYFPKKQKITVFDQQKGKIDCCIDGKSHTDKLNNGSLICYSIKPFNIVYSISHIELISMPLDLARLDIYFLHHILEVCYYFLNLSDPAHNVFDLIYYILFKNTISVPYSRAQKRVLICRFFMLLDMYREQEYLHNNWVQALLSVPIESILKQDLHPIQHSVDALLMHCFTMHPQKKQFKTSW